MEVGNRCNALLTVGYSDQSLACVLVSGHICLNQCLGFGSIVGQWNVVAIETFLGGYILFCTER